MKAGDEITVRPVELVAGGDALARIDGMPLFVANVFPGDLAVVRVTEAKKGFGRAELVRLVEPSPLRRNEPCPIAGECGGCDWTALRLDEQLRAKERILRESLRRIGKIDAATLPPITTHPSPLNYRLRSRLHIDGGKIGFFATRSNVVVQLSDRCEVVGVETARTFGTSSVIPSVSEGSGGAGGAGTHQQNALRTAQPPDPSLPLGMTGELGMTDAGELSAWEINGEVITDSREIEIGAGDFRFKLSTDAFFQVNRHLLKTMLDLVARNAERCGSKKTAVDLYSGVGFFTAPLARIFDRVTAVEGSQTSAQYALNNAAPNVRIFNTAVEEWVERMPKADFTFLDPPRSGARKNVIERISERTRSMICFLACDPVTFSRDASRLIASGWRLSTLDLIDLFPNTHHVETLSSFERAS